MLCTTSSRGGGGVTRDDGRHDRRCDGCRERGGRRRRPAVRYGRSRVVECWRRGRGRCGGRGRGCRCGRGRGRGERGARGGHEACVRDAGYRMPYVGGGYGRRVPEAVGAHAGAAARAHGRGALAAASAVRAVAVRAPVATGPTVATAAAATTTAGKSLFLFNYCRLKLSLIVLNYLVNFFLTEIWLLYYNIQNV